jgi:hypothetical protein
MGYSYEFSGRFRLRPPLSKAQRQYLLAFANTRRVERNAKTLKEMPDPLRVAVGLPVGPEGCYFIGAVSDLTREPHVESIVDENSPPGGQPGLWCQWVPNESGSSLQWNGGEKFHNFVEWLEYMIEHFLRPWGRVVEGRVEWQGDDDLDRGILLTHNNDVDVLGPIVVHERDEVRRLRVFLCHAAEDKHHVRRLSARLRDDNLEPWLDESKLLPGSDWELEIKRALRNTDAVIVCLSRGSVKKRGFVQREVRLAVRAAEEEPEGELFLFPLRLGPCNVPDNLRTWQWMDLNKRGTYARLLAGLAARASSLNHRHLNARR